MKEKITVIGKRREDIFATLGSIAVELPPVDISKIKEGDEVWVKVKISKYMLQSSKEFNLINWYGGKNDIVAHFPSPEKPKEIEELRNLLSQSWYNCLYNEIGEKQKHSINHFLADNAEFIQAINELRRGK